MFVSKVLISAWEDPNLQEAGSDTTTVIQLENRGRGAVGQVQGERKAQQVAAQHRQAVVTQIHLRSPWTASSKQMKTAGYKRCYC